MRRSDVQGRGDEEINLMLSRRVDEPFDLLRGSAVAPDRGPRKTKSVVAVVCHHIVGDAVSTWLVAKDFGALYFEESLPPDAPSYEQHVHAERELLDSSAGQTRIDSTGQMSSRARGRRSSTKGNARFEHSS